MTYIPTETRRLAQAAVRRTVRNDGIPGRIGLPDGTVYFTDPAGDQVLWMVYVRIGNPGNYSDITWAYSNGVAVYYDMPVIIRNIDGLPYITTEDGQRAVWWSGDTVATPYHRHDRFSANPIYLEGLAFTPFLVMPTNPFSMTLDIQPGFYRYGGVLTNYDGENTGDLSAYIPTSSAVLNFIIIALNRENNTWAIGGSGIANSATSIGVSRSDVATAGSGMPAAYYPLAAVVFYNGMTQIVAQDIGYDVRLWGGELYQPAGSGLDDIMVDADGNVMIDADSEVMYGAG